MTRCFTTGHVSCEPVWDGERRGEWRLREAGEAGSRLPADSEVESVFLRAYKYISLVPQRPISAEMASLHAKC